MDNNPSHNNPHGGRGPQNDASQKSGSSVSNALPYGNAPSHTPGAQPAVSSAMNTSMHRPIASFPQATPQQLAQMQSLANNMMMPSNSPSSGSSKTSGAPAYNASSAAWNVPNPLALSGSSTSNGGTQSSSASSQRMNPSQQQHHFQQIQQQHQQFLQQQQQRMQSAQQQQQQRAQASSQQAAQQQGPPVIVVKDKGKQKRVLNSEAKDLLARAVWSAIRDPAGKVAPDLLQQAISMGLPEQAILKAARVARERESLQRKGILPAPKSAPKPAPAMQPNPVHIQQQQYFRQQQQQMQFHQQQQQKQQQQQQKQQQQQMQKQQQQQLKLQQQQQQQQQQYKKKQELLRLQQEKQQRESEAKQAEQAKWQRAQSGMFMIQKGRPTAVPNTVGAVVRTDSSKALLSSSNAHRHALLQEAVKIQKHARMAFAASSGGMMSSQTEVKLLDPEKYKRVKLEAKKHAKALDRVARKSRQTVAESFVKMFKEFTKQVSSHQQEFFKFHRQRRADQARVCKTIRDNFDKESRKKEKDAVAAEKARMAALKANDMTAYSQLLEETKNERLQFLLEKTEKHFTQISSLLQQQSDHPSDPQLVSGEQQSYYATAHNKTEEVRQPGILVGGDLKAYQLTGLQWLVSLYNNRLNGILADEMGLGKTVQAIALLAYLMEFKHNMGPFLVIVPLSTMSNWENEFARWCPAARVVAYKGTPLQRREIFKEQVRAGQFNVLLTTYEYTIRDKKYLRKTVWQYAIVDEGHRMKNANSKFAVTLGTQYTTRHRILLTGTPLMNDLSELWSLLNFLLPNIFNSVDTFDQWFSRPFAQFGANKDTEDGADTLLNNEERVLIIHRLHELLRPFMLRRVKSEVLDQLPEKVEKVLRCDLSTWQKVLYQQISEKAFQDTGISATARGLNNVVMQLRKVCNHPLLFSPEGYHIGDTLIRSSGKVALLDQMLPKLKAAGHRVLMFTQMTAVMTILEDYFKYRGFLSLRLDGSTPAEEREKRMYKYNAPDSPYFIFLLSTRAGGLGLNLTSADTVIIFDSDWNPMMDLQAQDRAHRIGQRSDVSVFRLITNSPVEEKILSRATEKLNVSELVVESGKFNKESVDTDNSMERKRLMEVLLTDFGNNQAKPPPQTENKSAGSDDEDDEDGSESSEKEDLNELLSNNESDFQLYSAVDKEVASKGGYPALYVEDSDVPDWIRFPNSGPGAKAVGNDEDDLVGARKRKAVAYDDGLTEKQFLRMMDQKAQEEERAKKKAKVARGAARRATAAAAGSEAAVEDGEEDEDEDDGGPTLLTDWTYRKLISCAKSVVALKDATKKRRISEIFLDKPDPATFPDYYELIEKPIAINDILRKCRAKMYSNITEFRDDWKLMFANAVKFNGEGSWVVEDANALGKELDRVLKKNGFHDDHKPPTSKKKQLRIKLSLKDMKSKGGK